MITNQGNREREDIAVIVQSQLRKVGIEARTQLMEWGSLLDRIQDVDKRDYDAVIIAWVTEFRIDDTDLFHCDKLRDPYQWVSYCNPETDRLLDTLPTLVDRNASRPVWNQYQRQIAEQQPYTILYFTRRLEGVHERLRNVSPDARGDWVNIRQWYLLPNMRANR
jgi:peptide/nickel transport system substrate-binding protein